MIWLRFEGRQTSNQIECAIFACGHPTLLGRIPLEFDDFADHFIPCAPPNLGIPHGKIGASNLAVDERLILRLVLGLEEALGDSLIVGFETLAFGREGRNRPSISRERH